MRSSGEGGLGRAVRFSPTTEENDIALRLALPVTVGAAELRYVVDGVAAPGSLRPLGDGRWSGRWRVRGAVWCAGSRRFWILRCRVSGINRSVPGFLPRRVSCIDSRARGFLPSRVRDARSDTLSRVCWRAAWRRLQCQGVRGRRPVKRPHDGLERRQRRWCRRTRDNNVLRVQDNQRSVYDAILPLRRRMAWG